MNPQSSNLKTPTLVFIATWIVHTGDHIRRGYEFTPDGVIHSGFTAGILAAIALTLIFTEHRLAPFLATAVFPSLAIGVSATHLLPDWGFFSEPLIFDSAADTWAAVAAIPEIASALWLGVRAFGVVRSRGFQVPIPAVP